MLELRLALASASPENDPQGIDFADCTSLEAMVSRVGDHLGGESAVLVGFSMGGWVAQAVAARMPEVVEGVTLLASWTHAPAAYLRTVGDLDASIAGGAPLSGLRAAVASGMADRSRSGSLADRWVAMAERVGSTTFLAQTAAILAHPHVEEDAKQIGSPVLVLAGIQDALLPVAGQEADARRIPGAVFQRVEGSGHNLIWEQSAAVNAIVLDWLAQLSRG